MPKVGNKSFPYTKAGKKAAADARKKKDDYPPEAKSQEFSKNPMTGFRGNKTKMKRPSGRKR